MQELEILTGDEMATTDALENAAAAEKFENSKRIESSEAFLGRLHREKCKEENCSVCRFYAEVTVIQWADSELRSLKEAESERQEEEYRLWIEEEYEGKPGGELSFSEWLAWRER